MAQGVLEPSFEAASRHLRMRRVGLGHSVLRGTFVVSLNGRIGVSMNAFVYILRCADGSYYVGSARRETLDKRLGEHHAGTYPGYTSRRRPVSLVYAEQIERIVDAIACERRIKGWTRVKKEALMRGDWTVLQQLAKRPADARFRIALPT